MTEQSQKLKRIPTIYLAGGMRSGWQDAVKAALPSGVIWLDPRHSGSTSSDIYTAWDLRAVEMADVVLGFMEHTNPNGAGLAVEFGYAFRAGGKKLMYVEEPGFPFSRYFGMVREISTVTTMQLALQELARTYDLDYKYEGWEAFEASRKASAP